ncbi:serine/threonine-protein kinase [Sclerotinia borealis F-4128]|uniref:non-specific serine/threonine protein kinase n=1 Tax=Sclerotinia borealis (strain F-4128) TaxID=1432307 RepID=W9CQB9_SCLBF|nr:serine/threonine-protein kinase [Sclerotinia borealis F-4128]
MVRPQAYGEAVNNMFIFAAFLLVLPWLVDAQQQQRSTLRKHDFPPESVSSEARRTPLEATKVQTIETPLNIPRRKNTLSVNAGSYDKVDASADSAPLSPSHLAKSSRLESSSLQSAGWGSSQPSARDLQDWEVEDFVLLATVDGSVWARDRKTGKHKWRMQLPEVSMISTKHHRRNKSADFNEVPTSWGIDDYVWIVEPTEHGGLWIYRPDVPNGGLVDTGLTMKKLVDEMSPYQSDDPEVVYTGSRKTQMVHVDATNGKILQVFGGDFVVDAKDQSCSPKNGFVGKEADECQNPTIWLGLSKYEVNIVGKDHHPIATLMYNEWGPNVQDAKKYGDKYQQTLDSKYILAGQDGHVMGFDRERNRDHELLFQQKLPSPVVRVFDIFRPWGTEEKNLKLMMLPQPKPELTSENELLEVDQTRNSRVVISLSQDGSFYAMSGKSYPLAVAGSQAQCYQGGLWKHESWQNMDQPELAAALTGVHCIDVQNEPRLTISAPLFADDNQSKLAVTDLTPELLGEPTLSQSFQQIPRLAIDSVVEFIKNPVLILFLMILLISNQRQIRAWIGRHGLHNKKSIVLHKDRSIAKDVPSIDNSDDDSTKIIGHDTAHLSEVAEDKALSANPKINDFASLLDVSKDTAAVVVLEDIAVNDIESLSDVAQDVGDVAPTSPEKKLRKRGRRGGVKHKKGGNRLGQAGSDQETPQNITVQKPPPTVEDAVHNAQNMFPQKTLEPDIQTVSNDPAEVSGSKIRIGALEVDQNKLVGTGSNGTLVFEGNFDGRAVAVKRMLIQFYDIASQETKLLRESDDHPNVIRYFAQQTAAGFLYIALELCPASLADVIEKPHLHRDLAQGGEKDLPNVLYQIANGIQHLHNLRIVHRDLKPQNILVAMGKNGKPRLLVSDFGLCKKLEVEQSSFKTTTAHVAGTSGWRAPELILDDDIEQGFMVDTSTDGGGSGSILVSSGAMPNRRATRAIDIFALGLVFFYVLTKGNHPFDCGDRYMREVNVRKGNFNLDLLESLGDYAFEAIDLITSMLGRDPKSRPVAAQVMAHPFFWSAKKRLNFLCDVSDHFEKEKRDPPSHALVELERWAPDVCHGDFLRPLGKEFVDSMGKQRKYTGTRLLDLLRALRNKKNHYEDMSDKLKRDVGPLPDGYLSFWTRKFPNLLIVCWNVVYEVEWDQADRFKEYYEPAGL